MAKFLLACYPVSGHLHPNLALGSALRERGHCVAIYTGASAGPIVEREGFTFFPYGKELDHQLTTTLMLTKDTEFAADLSVNRPSFARLKQIKAGLSTWLLRTVPEQVANIEVLLRDWKPDVLVTDLGLLGPILVLHETQPVPVAVFSVLPACQVPGPDAPTWGRGLPAPRTLQTRWRSRLERMGQRVILAGFRAEASALRRRYGLPPLQGTVMEHTGRLPLYIVPSTPQFDYNRRDLPPTVHYVGPCLWHQPGGQAAEPWLKDLGKDRPVIHVTEGTIHVKQPVVLRAAAQGLAHADMDVVMTTGNHRNPDDLDLGPRAPNIRVERYVSHGDLFPHTDVVVTTGGAGTVLTALSLGVPLVVIPTGWDLPENAQRIVEAGVGLRIDPAHCTPKRLRAAVDTVLHNPEYRQNAQRLGEAFAREGGPPRAASLLENLAGTIRLDDTQIMIAKESAI